MKMTVVTCTIAVLLAAVIIVLAFIHFTNGFDEGEISVEGSLFGALKFRFKSARSRKRPKKSAGST